MKILYIDSETNPDNVADRVSWLRADHLVDVASRIDVSLNGYDLVIVNLGEVNGQSDMRPKLANSDIAAKAKEAGANLLFTGYDRGDMLFATKHGASYCHTRQLAQKDSREAALERTTGVSSLSR